MKDFPTLGEFLHRSGVNKDTPKDKVEALKKKHRKDYLAWYHKSKRKKDTHQYTLNFSKTEFAELQRVAKRYTPTDLPLALFIKKTTLAYISKQYLPRNEKLITTLLKEIRVIGNNVNQVIHSINRVRRDNQLSGTFNDEELLSLHQNYKGLVGFIQGLEKRLDKFMCTPPATLKQALRESLQDRPDKIDQLISYLLTIKKRTNAGSEKQNS